MNSLQSNMQEEATAKLVERLPKLTKHETCSTAMISGEDNIAKVKQKAPISNIPAKIFLRNLKESKASPTDFTPSSNNDQHFKKMPQSQPFKTTSPQNSNGSSNKASFVIKESLNESNPKEESKKKPSERESATCSIVEEELAFILHKEGKDARANIFENKPKQKAPILFDLEDSSLANTNSLYFLSPEMQKFRFPTDTPEFMQNKSANDLKNPIYSNNFNRNPRVASNNYTDVIVKPQAKRPLKSLEHLSLANSNLFAMKINEVLEVANSTNRSGLKSENSKEKLISSPQKKSSTNQGSNSPLKQAPKPANLLTNPAFLLLIFAIVIFLYELMQNYSSL